MRRQRPRLAPRLPTQERSHATVDAILDAVAHILIAHGSEGATVGSIARRAGVSVGSLYQYFATKDALVDACAQRAVQRSLKRLESQLPAVLSFPVREAVPRLIRVVVANFRADEALQRALLTERRSRKIVAEFQDRTVDLIRVYLESRTQELNQVEPKSAAFILVHGMQGVMDAALGKRVDHQQFEVLTLQLDRLVLSYLFANETPGGYQG
jgi:AcrR family transcriptional regulator